MNTTIIFDLDGLLAETGPFQMRAYQQTLLKHVVAMTKK
jgi:beta-phosphoglucomutase-like phosphatase (HAD superfamily)